MWSHQPKVVNSASKRSRIEVVRRVTTSSCFILGIPSGHSSGSHSTARAISFTRASQQQLGGGRRAFHQAKRPVWLCSAEQVKYARLQHRLQRKEGRSSLARANGDCFSLGRSEERRVGKECRGEGGTYE